MRKKEHHSVALALILEHIDTATIHWYRCLASTALRGGWFAILPSHHTTVDLLKRHGHWDRGPAIVLYPHDDEAKPAEVSFVVTALNAARSQAGLQSVRRRSR